VCYREAKADSAERHAALGNRDAEDISQSLSLQSFFLFARYMHASYFSLSPQPNSFFLLMTEVSFNHSLKEKYLNMHGNFRIQVRVRHNTLITFLRP
jgi:hypothetical protein